MARITLAADANRLHDVVPASAMSSLYAVQQHSSSTNNAEIDTVAAAPARRRRPLPSSTSIHGVHRTRTRRAVFCHPHLVSVTWNRKQATAHTCTCSLAIKQYCIQDGNWWTASLALKLILTVLERMLIGLLTVDGIKRLCQHS